MRHWDFFLNRQEYVEDSDKGSDDFLNSTDDMGDPQSRPPRKRDRAMIWVGERWFVYWLWTCLFNIQVCVHGSILYPEQEEDVHPYNIYRRTFCTYAS